MNHFRKKKTPNGGRLGTPTTPPKNHKMAHVLKQKTFDHRFRTDSPISGGPYFGSQENPNFFSSSFSQQKKQDQHTANLFKANYVAQNSLKHGTHLTSKLSHQNGVVLQFNHCYSNTRTKNGTLKSLFPSRFLPKTLQVFSGFPPQFRETIYLQGSCFQSPKVGWKIEEKNLWFHPFPMTVSHGKMVYLLTWKP